MIISKETVKGLRRTVNSQLTQLEDEGCIKSILGFSSDDPSDKKVVIQRSYNIAVTSLHDSTLDMLYQPTRIFQVESDTVKNIKGGANLTIVSLNSLRKYIEDCVGIENHGYLEMVFDKMDQVISSLKDMIKCISVGCDKFEQLEAMSSEISKKYKKLDSLRFTDRHSCSHPNPLIYRHMRDFCISSYNSSRERVEVVIGGDNIENMNERYHKILRSAIFGALLGVYHISGNYGAGSYDIQSTVEDLVLLFKEYLEVLDY